MAVFDEHDIQHVGVLVRDVDATASMLRSTLKCPMLEPYEFSISKHDVEVGEPGTLKILLARVGRLLIEFMEPLGGGQDVWSESLRKHGPGLHHICFTQIEAYQSVVTELQSSGWALTFAAHLGEDRLCYLESENFVIELASGKGLASRIEGTALEISA